MDGEIVCLASAGGAAHISRKQAAAALEQAVSQPCNGDNGPALSMPLSALEDRFGHLLRIFRQEAPQQEELLCVFRNAHTGDLYGVERVIKLYIRLTSARPRLFFDLCAVASRPPVSPTETPSSSDCSLHLARRSRRL